MYQILIILSLPLILSEYIRSSSTPVQHSSAIETAQADTAWQLVWSDEFNKPGAPDPKNWAFESGFVRNHEAQWYQPQNARCEGGMLLIEAKRESRPNPDYKAGSTSWRTMRPAIDYTSASLNTKQRHQWQYGRFEMRGRIDTQPGMWPAFWTLGVAGEWPANGEIDIMEYYRNMLLANVAWSSAEINTPVWRTTKTLIDQFKDPDWAKKFHTWRMDWDKTAIQLYVDDQLLNQVLLSETTSANGSGKNPFHQPHYLLLNVAIGGDNGGNPSSSLFPSRFEVDYVRVYQRNNAK